MLACSISAHSVFERDVAGVHPRPSLRDADAVPGSGVVDGRCRGSAPALVARRWTFTPSRTWSVALPGSVPDRVVRTLTAGSTWSRSQALPGFVPALVARAPTGTGQAASHRRCRGSAPALVARSRTAPAAAFPTSVAGARPRPSLRVGPRRGRRENPVAMLPGFVPGPRCATDQRPLELLIGPDDAGFAPALVARSSRRPGSRLTTRRCREPAPALVARGSPLTKRSVASGRCCRGSAPALVAQWTRGHSRTPRTGVAGRPPGPRCAMTLDLKQVLESDGRCRGPTPALVVRTCGRCNGRTA